MENLGFAAGSGWRRTPPARSRARSRRAPRVGPRFRAKPWSSPWLLLGAARRLRLCRPVRSGPLVRLAQRKRTNHRRAPPIDEIRSGPPPRPKPPETDGTVSPPMKPKIDRHARDFHRSMFVHFRSNVRFSARRASRSHALGGPSVGHRVFRRRAIDPRVRNPSLALRARIHTPTRRPLLNPYPRSARGPLASTSRRLDCRRPSPGGVEAPPRESTRARATPNTPPARPAARSS